MVHVVLLELAVEGGLADAKHARGGELVAAGLTQCAEDGAAFQFLKRKDFVFVRSALGRGVLGIRRQVARVDNGARAESSKTSRASGELPLRGLASVFMNVLYYWGFAKRGRGLVPFWERPRFCSRGSGAGGKTPFLLALLGQKGKKAPQKLSRGPLVTMGTCCRLLLWRLLSV